MIDLRRLRLRLGRLAELEQPRIEDCNNTPTDVSDSSLEKEGLRIVDISNPRRPRQAGFIETECGSHTQTLVPGGKRSYIYVQSYPLTDVDICTKANHPEGEISIVSFPTEQPGQGAERGSHRHHPGPRRDARHDRLP